MSNTIIKKILKRPLPSWEEGNASTFSFVITEDCQLRCKYCYVHQKNKFKKMNYEIAKKSINFFLKEKNYFKDKSVIFEFIGGEPFLEIDLIDKICDYIKITMFEKKHPWFDSYRFSITTNGILYNNDKVQEYIEKNKSHLSISLTIDGTKKKHDLNRIYQDGRGSYDDVVKNIPLWLKQFPDASTKVTVTSDDISYIKESVIHIWSLGIKTININVVFENVWKDGDDIKFEEQLTVLANYIIENELYKDHFCSFFTDYIGKPLDISDNQNWCGCGKKMLAIDFKGDFYPCNRFLPLTIKNKIARSIGNYRDGINFNILRSFKALNRLSQSPEECISCKVASGCALCVGLNYDDADTDTIYQRAIHICNMHKARVRANNYYWNKLSEKEKNI